MIEGCLEKRSLCTDSEVLVPVLHPIPGFTLMVDRQDQDSVLLFLKTVERNIT